MSASLDPHDVPVRAARGSARSGAERAGQADAAEISRGIVVIAAVNDRRVLEANLLRSPLLTSGRAPLVIQQGYPSAAAAYCAARQRLNAPLLVFAHQDVYLPALWESRLLRAVAELERQGRRWGVLGVFGVDARGRPAGRVWSSGLGRELCFDGSPLTPIVALDELVIVVNGRTDLTFDQGLPGFHLYGTDIVQTALTAGYETLVFRGPVIHNSRPVRRLDRGYAKAYGYIRRKWRQRLPLHTCVIPVTHSGLPLLRDRLRRAKRRLFQGGPRSHRVADVAALARRLGYEDARAL